MITQGEKAAYHLYTFSGKDKCDCTKLFKRAKKILKQQIKKESKRIKILEKKANKRCKRCPVKKRGCKKVMDHNCSSAKKLASAKRKKKDLERKLADLKAKEKKMHMEKDRRCAIMKKTKECTQVQSL